MAQTGQPGGRMSLENNRTGSGLEKPPSVESSPQSDHIAGASVRTGTPNTNRIGPGVGSVPETQKDFPVSGKVSTPQGRPNTNRQSSDANTKVGI